MSGILLDDELKAKLNGLCERIQVCDSSGKRVGWFVPEDEYKKLACLPDHSDHEADIPSYVPADE